MQNIKILDVRIDDVTFNQAINYANNFVMLKHPRQIVTVNPEFIMAAQKDEEFKDILNNADLNVPDGAGLVWASRFLRKPLKERVTGIDYMLALCALAEKRKYPIFLLGGEHGAGAKAAAKLKQQYPKLIISGIYEGRPVLKKTETKDYRNLRMTDVKPGAGDPNLEIVREVRKAKPKILFVAYGAPKQDKFIARYKNFLNIPVMMGVGGSFDFIAGKSIRAPKLMQKIGLEWLWRLFHEPKRWNRIITATIRFPWAVIKNKLTQSS